MKCWYKQTEVKWLKKKKWMEMFENQRDSGWRRVDNCEGIWIWV